MADKKIILALDDVTMNLMLVKEALSKDFDVRIAKSGEMALYVLGSAKVDLLLIDIDLPGMSGFDFLEHVREIPMTKDIPAIFVTAHTTSGFILRAKNMGAVDYIAKPIQSDVLYQKVLQALDMTDLD